MFHKSDIENIISTYVIYKKYHEEMLNIVWVLLK